jgi:hypothetical protein
VPAGVPDHRDAAARRQRPDRRTMSVLTVSAPPTAGVAPTHNLRLFCPAYSARTDKTGPRVVLACGTRGPFCFDSGSAGAQKTADYQALPPTGATGLEPATSGVTGRRSNRLSYAPKTLGSGSMARRGRRRGGEPRPAVACLRRRASVMRLHPCSEGNFRGAGCRPRSPTGVASPTPNGGALSRTAGRSARGRPSRRIRRDRRGRPRTRSPAATSGR